MDMETAVARGLKDECARLTRQMLETITPASKYFFSNLKNMNLPE
jgi:hypothetical protein